MIRQKLFENFAHPRGLWGRLAGEVMARKPANRERGRWALAELDPAPDDRVLEVGYGPGLSVAEACRRVGHGHVVGVDLSGVMLRQATRRNADAIREGRLELRMGDAQSLDADLRDLDLIYGINVWQFWSDQTATVRDLAMRPPAARRPPRPGVHAAARGVDHRRRGGRAAAEAVRRRRPGGRRGADDAVRPAGRDGDRPAALTSPLSSPGVSVSRRAAPPAPRGSAAREGWLCGARRAGS